MMGHPNISGNGAPFDEFIEVINDYEHERLTGSAVLQVKGSLRRNISFQSLFYQSFKMAIVFPLRQFPLGMFSVTICRLCIIQNLSRKQF